MSKLEDKSILEEIKKDKKGFDKIYNKYYKVVLNYIKSRINDKALGEDLTSEVFIKVYKAIGDFKWQGISISSWIFRIARNLLTDYYRKASRNQEAISLSEIENLFEDQSASTFTDFLRDEEEKVLYDAIREFSEQDQFLIYYKFFEGMSNVEIAKLTGLNESNVGTRLYRIKKRLRVILKTKNLF
ncbi:MAG: sigma-70 family RNA polymerase sigma factor [Candidatus Dojkabacteria bacterium]|nr:sigma-70 family RNA polymerase sigma factor [Candidatus Dojkabacteria bacterium]